MSALRTLNNASKHTGILNKSIEAIERSLAEVNFDQRQLIGAKTKAKK